MTGSRLIVLATGISVSGVETWVWKLARGIVDGETGQTPTAQQRTSQESQWIQTGSIAWSKRDV